MSTRSQTVLKQGLKHYREYKRYIWITVVLLVLALTPPLGQVLATSQNFQDTQLLDLLSPQSVDDQRVNRTQKVDDYFRRYMAEEIGQEISTEELEGIKNGNYSYYFQQSGSTDLPSLQARQKYLTETYQATASMVSSMEVVSSTVVAAASPSDASLSDKLPYDTMLLLDKQEKIYRQISQTLSKEIKVLKILELMVMLKPVFMPKFVVGPPPHLEICKSYNMVFPPILSSINWDELTIDQLTDELEGKFEGLAQGYVERETADLENFDMYKEKIENFDLEQDGEEGLQGFMQETKEQLSGLGGDLTYDDAEQICGGEYTKLIASSGQLAQLEAKRNLACSATDTFKSGMASKNSDTALSNCTGCAEGGPYLTKVEHYEQMLKDKVKTFLSMLVQKIQAMVKPQS